MIYLTSDSLLYNLILFIFNYLSFEIPAERSGAWQWLTRSVIINLTPFDYLRRILVPTPRYSWRLRTYTYTFAFGMRTCTIIVQTYSLSDCQIIWHSGHSLLRVFAHIRIFWYLSLGSSINESKNIRCADT